MEGTELTEGAEGTVEVKVKDGVFRGCIGDFRAGAFSVPYPGSAVVPESVLHEYNDYLEEVKRDAE